MHKRLGLFLSRLACPLDRFFTNPYHIAGPILARIVVNGTTVYWASLVLYKRDALVSSGARYAGVTSYVHEDLLAVALGLISALQLISLWRHREWTAFDNFGYALLSLCWGYAYFSNITNPGPLQTTSASTTAALALLALYAFLDGRPLRLHEEEQEHADPAGR